MLSRENSPQPVIAEKIIIASIGRRLRDDSYFKRIATALFSNKQRHIEYHARGQQGKRNERTISAQKIIYYRDNWYIAAYYCHYRYKLRIFTGKAEHIAVLEFSESRANWVADEL